MHYFLKEKKKKTKKPTLPSLMPVKGAACPGTASYPGPAEGCRLLQPCRANIRGRGKRPVSPSHHEMSQPDRRNQGGLSAALTRLWLGVSPPSPTQGATSSPRPAPLLTLPCPRQRSPPASASPQNFSLPGTSIPRSTDVPSWLADWFRSPPPAWLPPSLALFTRTPRCPPALVPQIPPSPFHSSSLCAPLPFPGCLSPSLIAMQSVAEKSVTPW